MVIRRLQSSIPIWGSEIVFLKCQLDERPSIIRESFGLSRMIDRCLSSSHFRKMISYKTCNIYRISLNIIIRQYICRTYTLAPHLNFSSSTIRTSHWLSGCCGFDPCLGLQNHFLGMNLRNVCILSTFVWVSCYNKGDL